MDFIAEVKDKYPHLADEDVISTVCKAKMFYYALKFPCEPNANEETHPLNSYFSKYWILAACDEIVERLGFNSAVAYKENGVSYSFDSAQISERLVSLIKPVVGTIGG